MTKTVLPDAPWRQNAGFDRLCAILGSAEDQVRLVGGAVRDGLLGIAVSDIDLATIHTPDEVLHRLRQAEIKAIPTGIDHGTITAIIDHHPFEITTLRRDVSTDGRRATIAFSTQWREDAARRDFTINALYASPLDGEVYDYFNGLSDLSARIVRFIGDADTRIAEDHLRIMRYFRFLARFGGLPPDPKAYAACIAQASSLMALSRERIADELMKLLALPDPSAVIQLMIEGTIFRSILPEIDMAGLSRLKKLIGREQEGGLPPSAPLRLAALLPADPEIGGPDIGGPDIGGKVAARLKLSNKARKRIILALTPPTSRNARELAFRIGQQGAMDQLLLTPDYPMEDIVALSQWQVPDMPIKGKDLIALGMQPGPDIARLLAEIKERWIAAGFPSAQETHDIAVQCVSSWECSSQ